MNDDVRLPRPSGRLPGTGAATSGPSASDPPDRTTERLERYAAATALTLPAELSRQIHARIASEPRLTPPRRFALALAALAPGSVLRALRDNADAALGRTSLGAVVRLQALGILLLVVLTVGALGAGSIVLARAILQPPDEPLPSLPLPTTAPSSTVPPTSSRQPGSSEPAEPSAAATSAVPSAAPQTAGLAATPSATQVSRGQPDRPSARPSPPPAPPTATQPGSGQPAPQPTTHPGQAPGTHPTPRASHDPHPTPHPSRKPHRRRTDAAPEPHPSHMAPTPHAGHPHHEKTHGGHRKHRTSDRGARARHAAATLPSQMHQGQALLTAGEYSPRGAGAAADLGRDRLVERSDGLITYFGPMRADRMAAQALNRIRDPLPQGLSSRSPGRQKRMPDRRHPV